LLYSHIIPLAAPGVLGQGLKWLFDSTSPFYIKPRLSPELVSWIWRFRGACREKNMRQTMGILSDLAYRSKQLYEELSEVKGLEFGYQARGHLKLYRTEQGLDSGLKEAQWMREFGIEAQVMESVKVHEMVPAALSDIAGGVYFPHDAHLIPHEFVVGLAKKIKEMGVEIRTNTEVLGFNVTGSEISALRTTQGFFSGNQIVLASGAWSPWMVRDLHLRLPIQAAKGYSVSYCYPHNRPENMISIPLLLKEAAVAVTPMNRTIRFSGTLELAGLDLTVNEKRMDAFLRNTRKYLSIPPDLQLIQIWRGLRPCTPDGLPVICRTKQYTNLILATGHGTIGMGLGPVTGELISQIISRKETDIDIKPLEIERFYKK
jgi:D-amino-acid dehydrogenase